METFRKVVESKRGILQLIPSLLAIIVGLAALVFPEYGLPLLVAFVVLLVGSVALWIYLSYRDLKSENAALRTSIEQAQRDTPKSDEPLQKPPVTGEHWKLIEEIDLLLDGSWDRTKSFDCGDFTRVRTTVVGKNRFIVHLADKVLTEGPRRRWTYHSIERTAETTRITRTWEILSEGIYAFVVEPVGAAPFHVTVRVEWLDKASMAIGIG